MLSLVQVTAEELVLKADRCLYIEEFLKAVSPDIAMASNGRHNKFHHPHKQAGERLDSLKIPLLNTSQKGTVQVEFDESGYRITTAL